MHSLRARTNNLTGETVGPSMDDRTEKVDKMLQRAALDDDKLTSSELELAAFSDEAIDLALIIKKIGQQRDVCNKQYITSFFKTFYLQRKGVERLDAGLLDFSNLRELDLSHNEIEELDYVSPHLEELYLTANRISHVSVACSPSLLHLSLAYNPVDDLQLTNIAKSFPSLFSLDAAFTQVSQLATVV